MTIDKLFKLLTEAGIPVERDRVSSGRERIIWDDFPNSHVFLELIEGVNGIGPAVFGEYESKNRQLYSLTGTLSDWMENFGEYLPNIRKGEKLW